MTALIRVLVIRLYVYLHYLYIVFHIYKYKNNIELFSIQEDVGAQYEI